MKNYLVFSKGDASSYFLSFSLFIAKLFFRDNNRITVIIHYVFNTIDGVWRTSKLFHFLGMDEAHTMLNELNNKYYPEH